LAVDEKALWLKTDAGAGSLRKTSDGVGFWNTRPKTALPPLIASDKAACASTNELPQ